MGPPNGIIPNGGIPNGAPKGGTLNGGTPGGNPFGGKAPGGGTNGGNPNGGGPPGGNPNGGGPPGGNENGGTPAKAAGLSTGSAAALGTRSVDIFESSFVSELPLVISVITGLAFTDSVPSDVAILSTSSCVITLTFGPTAGFVQEDSRVRAL